MKCASKLVDSHFVKFHSWGAISLVVNKHTLHLHASSDYYTKIRPKVINFCMYSHFLFGDFSLHLHTGFDS